jgi:hypothetical protein
VGEVRVHRQFTRRGFLAADGETVGREIASRLGVALERDKDVGREPANSSALKKSYAS